MSDATQRRDGLPLAADDLSTLDFMRTLSCIVVVSIHFSGMTGHLLTVMGRLSRVAVLIFFVHTSYVLMLSLERQLARSSQQLWRRFMVRRFFRVYPLTTFVITAILVFRIPSQMVPPGFHFLPLGIGGIVSNYALTMNLTFTQPLLSPMWSLPYEFQLYFVLPALFLLVRRWSSPAPVFGLCVITVALGFLQPLIPHGSRLDILEFAPCFITGIFCYKLSKTVKPVLPFVVWPILLLLYMSLCLLSPNPKSWPPAWGACFLAAVTAPFIHQTENRIVRGISHWIAQRSYAIYLSHYFCLWLAFRANSFPSSAQWTIFIATIVLLPAAFFRWIELPMINLGRRLSEPREVQPKELVAATAGSASSSEAIS